MLFHFRKKRIETLSNAELLSAIGETENDIVSRAKVLSGNVAEDQKHLNLLTILETLKNELLYRRRAGAVNA